MEEARKLKSEREANNELQGIKVDVDFQNMVEQEKLKLPIHKQHVFTCDWIGHLLYIILTYLKYNIYGEDHGEYFNR